MLGAWASVRIRVKVTKGLLEETPAAIAQRYKPGVPCRGIMVMHCIAVGVAVAFTCVRLVAKQTFVVPQIPTTTTDYCMANGGLSWTSLCDEQVHRSRHGYSPNSANPEYRVSGSRDCLGNQQPDIWESKGQHRRCQDLAEASARRLGVCFTAWAAHGTRCKLISQLSQVRNSHRACITCRAMKPWEGNGVALAADASRFLGIAGRCRGLIQLSCVSEIVS